MGPAQHGTGTVSTRELGRGLKFTKDSVEGLLADLSGSQVLNPKSALDEHVYGLPNVSFETKRWPKTESRRVVKLPEEFHGKRLARYHILSPPGWYGLKFEDGTYHEIKSPYGMVNDLLWVREPWHAEKRFDDLPPRDLVDMYVDLKKEGWAGKWRHLLWFHGDPGPDFDGNGKPAERGRYRNAMFLPKALHRIQLELIGLDVQHLSRMDWRDQIAEGAPRGVDNPLTAHVWFRDHWNAINGSRHPFDSDPLVWRLVFRRALFKPARGRTVLHPPQHHQCRCATLTST